MALASSLDYADQPFWRDEPGHLRLVALALAEAQALQAQAEVRAGVPDEVLRVIEPLRRRPRMSRRQRMLVSYLHGWALKELNDPTGAVASLAHARECADALPATYPDHVAIIRIEHLTGCVEGSAMHNSKAAAHHRDALRRLHDLAAEQPSLDPDLESSLLVAQAVCLLMRGDLDGATAPLMEAMALGDTVSPARLARWHWARAMHLRWQGLASAAVTQLEHAVATYERATMRSEQRAAGRFFSIAAGIVLDRAAEYRAIPGAPGREVWTDLAQTHLTRAQASYPPTSDDSVGRLLLRLARARYVRLVTPQTPTRGELEEVATEGARLHHVAVQALAFTEMGLMHAARGERAAARDSFTRAIDVIGQHECEVLAQTARAALRR
jgi:hypothetical protein